MKTKNVSKMMSLLLAIAMMVGILTVAANAADVKFTDVPSTHWAYSYVTACADKGYVNGVGNNQFAPDGKLTYAQVFTMLTNAFFKAEKQDYENNKWMTMDNYFGGNPEWWSYNAYYFMDNGLLEGTSVNIKSAASANAPITRYEMVQIVSNILASKGISVSSADKVSAQGALTDWNKIPAKYQGAVATCVSLGIISGYSDKSFGGNDSLTRAQACVILSNLVKVVENGGGTTTKPPVQDVEQKPIYEYCTCPCDACRSCTGHIVGYEPVEHEPEQPSKPTVSTKDIEVTTLNTQYGTGYYVKDNGFGTGYLNNGKPITEENVLELLEKAEQIWPTGMSWTVPGTKNNHWYEWSGSVVDSILLSKHNESTNYACGGFAAMISDYLFGLENNPGRLVTDHSKIRPGDIIISMRANGSPIHVMVATSSPIQGGVYDGRVHYTSGNASAQVSWPDEWAMPINNAIIEAMSGPGCYMLVYTRYPA